ncbi:MAG TPA: CpsD/CapB family tyrosine-protein kinase [Candidatus Kryptonia bacterium]|nr:CpsD/CapB family tyrosine-protein kinase [Candidatus Kryptonia bacterium]
MSKIYEALKKAEQERERSRTTESPLGVPRADHISAGADSSEDGSDEDYQRLRASLVGGLSPSALHTILVTAARHGEGASTVAIGLATALAKERETRVLLVEGNVRMPSLARLLPTPPAGGLNDFLSGKLTPEALVSRVDALNFSVIVAGNSGRQALDLEQVASLLARLRPQFDFIVIDTPPVNRYADACMLAPRVDGVILVVEADRTPVTEAEAAKRQLDKVDARILGVVLNRRRSYIPAFIESLL